MRIDAVIEMAAAFPPTGGHSAGMRAPLLERLVARGDPLALHFPNLAGCLCSLFDWPDDRLPVAALSLLGEGGDPGSSYWVRIDPVHLRAERTHLLLVPLSKDDLDAQEAQALTAALAPHLAAEGDELLACHPQRWYLRSRHRLPEEIACPKGAAGMLNGEKLPGGPEGAHWRRLLTEAQMLLHEAAVNAAREAQGKLPVNGVWVWGGGSVPKVARSAYATVYADQVLVLGIARATGSAAASLSHAPEELPRQRTNVLLVIRAERPEVARTAETWASFLLDALGRKQCDELRLILIAGGTTVARCVRPVHLRRWWRRARPLALHA